MALETILYSRGSRAVLGYDESNDTVAVMTAGGLSGHLGGLPVYSDFVPVLGGDRSTSGQTYTRQLGKLVKLDKVLFFMVQLQLAAKGVLSGTMQVQGLPVPIAMPGAWAVVFANLATPKVCLFGSCVAGATAIDLYAAAAAGASLTKLATADIADTTAITLSGYYLQA